MTGFNTEHILADIEAAIRSHECPPPEHLVGDKYLHSSALQKSVRFGAVETATRAAVSLWYADRQNFWRRLHIIALEDVGIGDPDAVIKVLTATASPKWRRKIGDMQLGLFLTRMLCETVKSRATDELYIQLERAACHHRLRERFAKASNKLLAGYVTDEESPLVERSLALWYLAGTKKFPSDIMPQRKGAPEEAIKILRSLKKVPAELVESCIGVMNRTSWPLSIFLPVVCEATRKQTLRVVEDAIPTVPTVEGIPIYAADVFTRVGQASFRELQRTVTGLRAFTVKQIGIALFSLEGGRIDKRITSDALGVLQQDGEIADAEGLGLYPLQYLKLRELVASNMHTLNEIRCARLQSYLEGEPEQKINAIQGKPTFTRSDVNGEAV